MIDTNIKIRDERKEKYLIVKISASLESENH